MDILLDGLMQLSLHMQMLLLNYSWDEQLLLHMPMHLENPKQRVTKEITYAITNDQPINEKRKPDDSRWKYNTKGSTNGWNHGLSSEMENQ